MAIGFGPATSADEAAWLDRLLADEHRIRRVREYQASYVAVVTLAFAAFGLLWGVSIWWQIALAALVVFLALAWSQTRTAIRRAELGLQEWRAQAADRVTRGG